jgi:hypothetical protein
MGVAKGLDIRRGGFSIDGERPTPFLQGPAVGVLSGRGCMEGRLVRKRK